MRTPVCNSSPTMATALLPNPATLLRSTTGRRVFAAKWLDETQARQAHAQNAGKNARLSPSPAYSKRASQLEKTRFSHFQ